MFLSCIVSFMAAILGFMSGGLIFAHNRLIGDLWALYFPNDYSSTHYTGIWSAHSAELLALRDQMSLCLGISLLLAIIALATLVYLLMAVGDRDEDGKIILKRVDRIYTEFQLLIVGFMFVAGGILFVRFSISAIINGLAAGGIIDERHFTFVEPTVIGIAIAVVVGFAAAATGLWMFLSCVRKLKAGCFLKQSIIGKICIALYEAIYKGGSLMRKVMLAAIGGCLLSATIFLAPVVLVLIFIFLPRLVREFEDIQYGVEEVRNGNLGFKIALTGKGEFDKLSQGINEISQSSNAAVQNEMKNQRMKVELISNVSHDIRTPLTSLITYIDLLKTEGLTSENAPEYLEVLDQKTSRLKQLTDDLFEAAKASSGAIPVRKEKVDLLSLVNQGLGEMDQRIADSGLDMIVGAKSEKYYVWADGQLLWRVVENLLTNVLKYAQQNSRVYIDISEQGVPDRTGMVILEIKNISRQALNIDADELMERFKRGDEARATDGSGLGLAIARDLVKLQNGWLDIKIDGDLFKSTVMLEKAEEDIKLKMEE